MSAKTSVLLLGATGYIGSTVLTRLLTPAWKKAFEIKTVVRSEEKAKKLETFGVVPVLGSIKDAALLEKVAAESHIVINIADADDLSVMDAILKGLKKRHEKTGVTPILIHTSGSAFIIESMDTRGQHATDKIYYDDDVDQMANIPPTALHRNVDIAVVAADKEGYVKTYIVSPPTIWGIGKNPLTEAGIANTASIQIPLLIKACLARGRPGMVGKGLAIWNNINVEEQADFYIILLDAILTNPDKVGHGVNGYYFGEADEHSWYELSKAIGKAMVKLGLSKTDEPDELTDEELTKYYGGSLFFGLIHGTNARSRARHSKSLGWNPKLGRQAMFDSIYAEVEAIHKQTQKA